MVNHLRSYPLKKQTEAEDLNNLLYVPHTTPVIDHIGLATITQHTSSDDVNLKIQQYADKSIDCQTFSTKKTSERIQPHKVPTRCWEKVAVDLFGPMPLSHHGAVVQDFASRYPSAKIVSSTKAAKVFPALADFYNSLGNPEQQISDNGPPFNSKEMEDFAGWRNISLQEIPSLHPTANPVETFMRPLGKAMKIAYHNRTPENDTLNQLVMNYRDTPHPATGVTPAAMLFRDAHQYNFQPQKMISCVPENVMLLL